MAGRFEEDFVLRSAVDADRDLVRHRARWDEQRRPPCRTGPAVRRSSSLTVGSSPKTSSPTAAAVMAASMPGVGFVTVSLRRSIMAESQVIKSQVIKSISRQVLKSQDLATWDLTTCDLMTEGNSHPRFLPGNLFLPILQEPAVADLLEIQRPVLHVRMVREPPPGSSVKVPPRRIFRRSRTDWGSLSSFSSTSLNELPEGQLAAALDDEGVELGAVHGEAILGGELVAVGQLEVALPREIDLRPTPRIAGPGRSGATR